MKYIAIFLLLAQVSVIADSLEKLGIASNGGKGVFRRDDGSTEKVVWGVGGFGNGTTNTIQQIMAQLGESSIASVSGIILKPKEQVWDLQPVSTFDIDDTTQGEVTGSKQDIVKDSQYMTFEIRKLKAGVVTVYDTKQFPTNLRKAIDKLWGKFEKGNP